MEEELVQAILIASDPSQGSLHHQALEYLSNIQQHANDTWRLALALFVDVVPDGNRKYPPQARFFALRVLDEFFDSRFDALDDESFRTLQQSFMNYIQTEFVYGSAEAGAPFLRNKFSHTLTLFFLRTYIDQWSTFFIDLFTMIHPAESSDQPAFNRHVSLLFFHVVLEISEEVADQVIKSARPFNQIRHTRDGRVRDAVRERDAARINDAVLTIVADGSEKLSTLRKAEQSLDWGRELDGVVEVVDCGIRTFGSYVSWIDINLTVTPTTIPLLFSLLSDPSLPIRLATTVALHRILGKGLKEPGDKLHLIKVLSLGQVIDALETKTASQQADRGSETDEGEESYREALGKLLNVLGLELTKLVEDYLSEDLRTEASALLNQILPVMLRFLADEYDDTCSTVFPLLQTILSSYKRARKLSSEPLDDSKRSFLASLLEVILQKMKWDEGSDPSEVDDEDKAAFEVLRKELRTFMDAVLVIDQELVTGAVRTLSLNTLNAYRNGFPLKWHDAELAVYLVYIFGEINKSGGKGRAAFCLSPAGVSDREKRQPTDYSTYPLTTHGEMLLTLVQSGISSYPHPTVTMQFFETAARYSDFFKIRKECIMPTLEPMVGSCGLHSQDSAVRSRVFYLFLRFVKENKNDISVDLALTLIDGIRDLLSIQVDTAEIEGDDEQATLEEAVTKPGLFDSQIYLFETVGTLLSHLYKMSEQHAPVLLSVVKPLLDDLSTSFRAAIKDPQNVQSILEVHHIIMALGNVAKGFPEFPSHVTASTSLPPLDLFGQIAQAILVCLEAMNIFKIVRDASRFAFARILATTGPNITHFIPPLMANLLVHFEASELIDFIHFIGFLVHKLQKDLFDVLDELISPLSTHILSLLAQPVTGTDDSVNHDDTKKAYIALLNNIMSSKLQGVFISERNKGGIETLLEAVQRFAEDVSDPVTQRTAFVFLGRCVNAWGQSDARTGGDERSQEGLPGFEQFIFERLVPTAFGVPWLPAFNLKDGQMISVLHEIANFIQIVCRTRGTEVYDYFLTVFLPSQNWPSDTALEFTTKMRDLDDKNFRKYFTDFVRSSRS